MEFVNARRGVGVTLPPRATGICSRYGFVFPRVLGDGTGTQVIAAIRNTTTATSNPRTLEILRWTVYQEETAAVVGPDNMLRVMRAVASAIGGGTAGAKSLADSLYAGLDAAGCNALCATPSDGAAATPITGGAGAPAGISANAYSSGFGSTLHTAVGQRYNAPQELLRVPLILRYDEAALVQVCVPGASNAASRQYALIADCIEYYTK